MALSQFIPDIRIGYPYTYWGPLGFVLTVTICREAIDDYRRHQRDREVNSQKYKRLIISDTRGYEMVPSSKLKVGDMIIVEKNERVPADLILLRTSDRSGSVFVRTDQLDGMYALLEHIVHKMYIFNACNFNFQVKLIGNYVWLFLLRKNLTKIRIYLILMPVSILKSHKTIYTRSLAILP